MESLPPPTAFIFTYIVKHKFFDIYIYVCVRVTGIILSCGWRYSLLSSTDSEETVREISRNACGHDNSPDNNN